MIRFTGGACADIARLENDLEVDMLTVNRAMLTRFIFFIAFATVQTVVPADSTTHSAEDPLEGLSRTWLELPAEQDEFLAHIDTRLMEGLA